MRILIVGGGVSGLGLANRLAQHGIIATVIEKTGGYGGVGFTLKLWPFGTNQLQRMGFQDDLERVMAPFIKHKAMTSSGNQLVSMTGDPFSTYGSTVTLKRKDLMEILLGGAKRRGVEVKFNTTVERIEESEDEVTVTLSDGSTDTYDLVVGADGIYSQVRKIVFGSMPLNFTGYVGYAWWLDPSEWPTVEGTQEYFGSGKLFGVYTSKDAMCVFCVFPGPQNSPKQKDERIDHVISVFSDFGGIVPDVLRRLKLLNKPDELFYHDYSDFRMDRWHTGRFVLIGDACHAFLPTGAFGSSMALESACVLADELSSTDLQRIQNALQQYFERRKPRVDRLQTGSRKMLKMMLVSNPILTWARNKLVNVALFKPVVKEIKKVHEEPF